MYVPHNSPIMGLKRRTKAVKAFHSAKAAEEQQAQNAQAMAKVVSATVKA